MIQDQPESVHGFESFLKLKKKNQYVASHKAQSMDKKASNYTSLKTMKKTKSYKSPILNVAAI